MMLAVGKLAIGAALFFVANYCVTVAQSLTAAQADFIFTDAPFRSSHASSVVELRGGDLLSTWFGGSAEGKPDVAIWFARRHNGGWSAPAELARERQIATYNPVLFYSKDGRLWFYYKFGLNPASWSAARRWSGDDGKTWSQVEHLPAGITGPIRTKPLVMEDGTIVSGTSVESYGAWAVWIERSNDNGITWRRIGPITVSEQDAKAGRSDKNFGIIQPTVLQMSGSKLRLYARSTRQIGRICIADSNDAGLTWTNARPLDLPNPNSGIDAVHLRDGRYVIVYNDSTFERTPLNLALSNDGEHFRNFKMLESEPGEYSYPALIESAGGGLDITYTWNRKRIKYVHVRPSEIKLN